MQCAHWHHVPLNLAKQARRKMPHAYLDRVVPCHLPTHEADDHHGLLTELDEYGAALWLRWRGEADVELAVLPDCPAVRTGLDGDGCCLFAGHVEQHTWEDTEETASCTR
ncbi:hypothetical protein NEH83_19225 [Streptomyces sp. JUS-F4]|nr:hypothetical protein [Streptomyces sp. JUS-F4]MDX2669260.1 hypothetical protein [Streptomyces sp. NRRL_ISP-5395]WKN19511.1 hypothetical protein NEH83_19225 [Streptomyces sp. JUS-F4]GHF45137.1 hypothetical protein GCM10010504_11220 [Streptomyces griseus]